MDATNQNVTINWVLIYMYVRVKKYVPYSSNHQQKLNIDAQIIFLFFLFCDLLIVFMFFILFFYYCEKDTWSDKLIAELEKKLGVKIPTLAVGRQSSCAVLLLVSYNDFSYLQRNLCNPDLKLNFLKHYTKISNRQKN